MTSNMTFAFPKTATRPELIVDGSDAELRRLLYDITALAERIEQMRSTFAQEIGVTKPQYSVLLHIAQHQGEQGITAGEIASALYVSRAHVTKETAVLIDLGLLEKTTNPDDGRSVLLRVTEKAAGAIDRLAPILCATNDSLFASLSRESFAHLSKTLSSILRDAETTMKRLPGFLVR